MAEQEFRADWAQKDFYAVLGVAKDASAADIKKAYKKLARENHPDTHPGDDERLDRFKSVAEAYDVVGDAEKRKSYDQMRELYASGGMGGMGGMGGPGGMGGFRGAHPGGAQGINLEDLFGAGGGGAGFGEMFGDLFGGGGAGGARRQARRPARGADVETSATISFTDAVDGVTVSLRLSSEGPCATCRGTGGKPGTQPHACPHCEGTGFVVASLGGAFTMNETCPACGGQGLVYDEACPTCRGTGRGTSSRTVQARIPAGVKDGQRIRLRGKGAPGQNGGPAGDLYVAVKVTPHRLFGRKGDHLTLDVPISFDEAALGAEIRVPTLGGAPVTLKLPAGTPNGRTFRVRGKGGKKADGGHGDLLATVQVQVPAVLDDAARAAVEAYRAATASKPLRANLFEEAAS